MKRGELQKRINRDIEEYLNKYQVMLEYGRFFLDKDKSNRSKYKWIEKMLKILATSAVTEILLWSANHFLSSELLGKCMPYILGLCFLSLISYILFFYYHRKKIACLVEPDEKKELISLLDDLQSFLNQLYKWIKIVAYGQSPNEELLQEINERLSIAQSKQEDKTNKISIIQGELDSELDKKAHNVATERLEPYKHYFYPYE